MKVALTFDIEFNVNHAMEPPFNRRPLGAECVRSSDRGGPAGLDYVLAVLSEFDLRATFFIEALQSVWFGDREMGAIAERIAKAGHEVQLHVHPVWRLFDRQGWQQELSERPALAHTRDSLPALPEAELHDVLALAQSNFARWDVPAPRAIRTGGLVVERPLYEAFRTHGLAVSSSVGLALHVPEDEALHHYSQPFMVDGVAEFPVASYLGADVSIRRKTRLATLIGMGSSELSALLEAAERAAMPGIVLLSHMSEFFRLSEEGRVRRNPVVERRFRGLCQVLASDSGMHAVTINDLAAGPVADSAASDLPLKVGRMTSLSRFVERLAR